MSDFASWFLSVVVVGIAINLLSEYLKPYVDKYFNKRFDSRKIKNEREQSAIKKEALEMLQDPQLFIYNSVRILYYYIGVSTCLILVFLIIVINALRIFPIDTLEVFKNLLMGKDIDLNVITFSLFKILFVILCFVAAIAGEIARQRINYMQRIFNEYWKLKKESSLKETI